MNFTILLYIGVGGFLGAVSRFGVSSWLQNIFSAFFFPIGTLGVNVIGSFIIGFLIPYFEHITSHEYRALFIVGFLGSFTTFSTFSHDTMLMFQTQEYFKAFLNITLNVILCVIATILGAMIFKKIIALYFN